MRYFFTDFALGFFARNIYNIYMTDVNKSFSIPLPRYFAMTPIGLDISDRSFKYVKLQNIKHGKEIDFFGEGTIPNGVIKEGVILKRKELADALREELSKRVKANHPIALSLPDEKAFSRPIVLPKMSVADLRSAIELQIEEVVPLPRNEATFDFEVVHGGETKKTLDVVVSAYPQNIVEEYLAAVMEAGLKPVIAESESRALARVVLPSNEHGSVMLVDIGRTRISIFMAYEQIVRYTTTVVSSVHKSANASEVSPAVRGTIIRQDKAEKSTEQKTKIFSAPLVSELTELIEERLHFWKSYVSEGEHGGKQLPAIRKIYITGGESQENKLAKTISQKVNLPVVSAEPWKQLFDVSEYIPDITAKEMLRYGTALGLATRTI